MARTTQPDHPRSAAYSKSVNRAKLLELIGFDTIVYRIDDDPEKEFSVPHPMMYDSETRKILKEIPDENTEEQLKVALGDEQYERFLAEGGDLDDLGLTIQLVSVASQRAVQTGTPLKR